MHALILIVIGFTSWAFGAEPPLAKRLKGAWKLKEMRCNGQPQKLAMDYTLSFNGNEGAYTSKTAACTQVEPERYTYLSDTTLAIKQGVRTCLPSPCQADLPADRCGTETNPETPSFEVAFKDSGKTLILSTSDPKSIDCVEPGQSKPAIFTFTRR